MIKRGVLRADVAGFQVQCTHMTAQLDVVPYPAEGRFRSALRALQPQAVVICGSDARLDVLAGPLRRLREDGGARLHGYRAARLVAGRDGVPSLGEDPSGATDALLTQLS